LARQLAVNTMKFATIGNVMSGQVQRTAMHAYPGRSS